MKIKIAFILGFTLILAFLGTTFLEDFICLSKGYYSQGIQDEMDLENGNY